jgi:hypothetical protein
VKTFRYVREMAEFAMFSENELPRLSNLNKLYREYLSSSFLRSFFSGDRTVFLLLQPTEQPTEPMRIHSNLLPKFCGAQ